MGVFDDVPDEYLPVTYGRADAKDDSGDVGRDDAAAVERARAAAAELRAES